MHSELWIDSAPVAVIVADSEGRLLAANKAACQLFAYPAEIGLSPVQTPGGPYVIATIVDITDRKRRERESTLARLVQEAMLPRIPEMLPGLEIAAKTEQAEATGGDLYDLVRFPDGRFESTPNTPSPRTTEPRSSSASRNRRDAIP